jgi:hypothetical protein
MAERRVMDEPWVKERLSDKGRIRELEAALREHFRWWKQMPPFNDIDDLIHMVDDAMERLRARAAPPDTEDSERQRTPGEERAERFYG